MNAPEPNPSPKQAIPAPHLTPDNVVSVLLESAGEAFGQAILITVLGSIAIGIVGTIGGEMTPSLPPGLARPATAPEVEATGHWNLWSYFQQHRFVIIFSILFALRVWSKLAGTHRTDSESPSTSTRAGWVGRQFVHDWFGLIVVNAFGALISAMVLNWVQQFSFWYWARRWIFESIIGSVRNVAAAIFGGHGVNTFGAWFGWYGENQVKLAFWVFYLAAICDDLGIPNLKTLGRWSWRRWLRHKRRARCYG